MKKTLALISTLFLAAFGSDLGAQQYTIEDLGTLSATPTDAMRAAAINNRGHVHGDGDRTDPMGSGFQQRSYLWVDGVLNQIDPPVMGSAWRGDVNDSDEVVGHYTASSAAFLGYLWKSNLLTPFNVGVHDFVWPTGINSAGFSTGTFTSNTSAGGRFRYHAFLRKPNGIWFDLGTLGGLESYGAALNDARHVVGKSHDSSDIFQAFSKRLNQPMLTLTSLGGGYAEARDVNNYDVIVGAAFHVTGKLRPVIWEQGAVTELPTLGGNEGQANALNDFGIAVGYAKDSSDVRYACLWEGGVVVDLNSLIPPGSNWVLKSASDINELGEVCGTGLFHGLPRAFKLTPVLNAPRISGFQPAKAGELNTLFGLGFTPNSFVDIYAGLVQGTTLTSCGAVVDIHRAQPIASLIQADAKGRIEFDFMIPAGLAGRSGFLQAVEVTTCTVGELRAQVLR